MAFSFLVERHFGDRALAPPSSSSPIGPRE